MAIGQKFQDINPQTNPPNKSRFSSNIVNPKYISQYVGNIDVKSSMNKLDKLFLEGRESAANAQFAANSLAVDNPKATEYRKGLEGQVRQIVDEADPYRMKSDVIHLMKQHEKDLTDANTEVGALAKSVAERTKGEKVTLAQKNKRVADFKFKLKDRGFNRRGGTQVGKIGGTWGEVETSIDYVDPVNTVVGTMKKLINVDKTGNKFLWNLHDGSGVVTSGEAGPVIVTKKNVTEELTEKRVEDIAIDMINNTPNLKESMKEESKVDVFDDLKEEFLLSNPDLSEVEAEEMAFDYIEDNPSQYEEKINSKVESKQAHVIKLAKDTLPYKEKIYEEDVKFNTQWGANLDREKAQLYTRANTTGGVALDSDTIHKVRASNKKDATIANDNFEATVRKLQGKDANIVDITKRIQELGIEAAKAKYGDEIMDAWDAKQEADYKLDDANTLLGNVESAVKWDWDAKFKELNYFGGAVPGGVNKGSKDIDIDEFKDILRKDRGTFTQIVNSVVSSGIGVDRQYHKLRKALGGDVNPDVFKKYMIELKDDYDGKVSDAPVNSYSVRDEVRVGQKGKDNGASSIVSNDNRNLLELVQSDNFMIMTALKSGSPQQVAYENIKASLMAEGKDDEAEALNIGDIKLTHAHRSSTSIQGNTRISITASVKGKKYTIGAAAKDQAGFDKASAEHGVSLINDVAETMNTVENKSRTTKDGLLTYQSSKSKLTNFRQIDEMSEGSEIHAQGTSGVKKALIRKLKAGYEIIPMTAEGTLLEDSAVTAANPESIRLYFGLKKYNDDVRRGMTRGRIVSAQEVGL